MFRSFRLGAPPFPSDSPSRGYHSEDGEMTLDDGTPPAPSFVDDLAIEPDEPPHAIGVAAGDELLNFEPPTQAPGFASFVLADQPRLAHPRLVPRGSSPRGRGCRR